MTKNATAKLTNAPMAPNAFGSIPKNQLGFISPKNEVDFTNMMP
jgi:hypothetical protein